LDLAATNQVTYEAKSKDISLEVYPKQGIKSKYYFSI